jgi:hypothetical protein
MPFCPNCRFEYREGVTRCPDCDVVLVNELPPADDLGRDESIDRRDWVPLVRLTSRQYAEMMVEELRDKNIPVIMRSETGHFGATGQMGTSTFRPVGGGYTLFVPEDYLGQADSEGEAILGDVWVSSRLVDYDSGE